MTLAEELRRKYQLTSLRTRGEALALLAINDALEAAAHVADQEQSPKIAARIRALKWATDGLPAVPVPNVSSVSNSA